MTPMAATRRPIRIALRFVATCPTCRGRISPDQVMCTACALKTNPLHTKGT